MEALNVPCLCPVVGMLICARILPAFVRTDLDLFPVSVIFDFGTLFLCSFYRDRRSLLQELCILLAFMTTGFHL